MAGTLSFSNDGPDFPGKFVDSLLAGDVIFLCGTGVSAPQMPSFQQLVKDIYSKIMVPMTDSEKYSFDQGRFEEVLGSLSRRLSDPGEVTATVSDLLAVSDDPELDQHRTILRLSRGRDNRVSVVTTNFDTLLERAAVKDVTTEDIANISFAGQSIPAPGSAAFSGIIHIHGRLADKTIGLESTPLVLSSADYGDAYMRSGWVSRFLFDLARCKTIVLVGYSASDAPVRYFLNVLEADRMRFPDLKPVYAFDAYEHDPKEASKAWGTLAVIPLPYRKASPGDHSPLWCDLAALGDVVDRRRLWPNEKAINILDGTAAGADTKVIERLRWLFGGDRDLWSVAIKTISDPKWFDVFEEERLWSRQEATFVIARWIARDFENHARIECACEWQRRLGSSFTAAVEQLLYRNNVDGIWLRIWRLFCFVDPLIDLSKKIDIATRLLKSDVTVYGDLERAVQLLAPALVLDKSNIIQPIKRLRDVVQPRMKTPNLPSIKKLIDTLCDKQQHALCTLDLATAQLRSTLHLEADLELITEEYDHNDFTVPSIEPHAQNRHHDGVNHLVRVLVKLLPAAVAMNRERTRDLIFSWKNLPGRIGRRLRLHAMRNTEIFEADEAMDALLSASEVDFWSNKREVPLLLRDRAGAASRCLTIQVESRILHSASNFYERYYQIEPHEVDWREHARDNRVWIHLMMLQEAGVLSPTGSTELSAIRKRRSYLDRTVEDRDFFGSYVSEARSVAGDSAPISEAAGDDRLRVASELRRRPELENRLGWSEYCRDDPQGAFDALADGDLSSANGTLWNDFLIGIEFGHESSKPTRDDLAVKSFSHLADASDESLRPMASGLASLLLFGPRQRIADVDRWLRRLWDISTQLQSPLGHSTYVYELASQEVAGKVIHTLLSEIDARKQNDKDSTAEQLKLLSDISRHMGTSGEIGRTILAYHLSFVISVSQLCVVDVLKDRIESPDEEGATLRAVMLSNRITPKVTRELRDAVLKGAIESKAGDSAAATKVAANILRPALAAVPGEWGLTASDVASVLRKAPQNIRIAALKVLRQWINKDTDGELFWRGTLASFFESVWPKEREFLDVSLTDSFIGLVIAAGNEFPAALKRLNPYMVPLDGESYGLQFISSSQAPEVFPEDVLSLLWIVCGPASRGTFYSISEIIDRLTKADPKLEVDRRLQWLEHRAERYN